MSLLNKKYPKLFTEDYLIYYFCFIILWNLGFHILLYFPLHQSPDIQEYLEMAQCHFDQGPVRRYRIIVPFLSGITNHLFGWIFALFYPWTFEGDFSLCCSFLLLNTAIMSLAFVFIYKLCRLQNIPIFYSLVALTAVLTGRWSAELSGLPLVDSLLFLSLVLAIYGIKTERWIYVYIAIGIGPWAKESFIFMVPVLLYFSKPVRTKVFLMLLLSGLLVLVFRLLLDEFYSRDFSESFRENANTFSNIRISLNRLFSAHGLYDLFSVSGFWIGLPLIALFICRTAFFQSVKHHLWLDVSFLLVVVLQALLSTEISRMMYLFTPVYMVWISMSIKILAEKLNQEKTVN